MHSLLISLYVIVIKLWLLELLWENKRMLDKSVTCGGINPVIAYVQAAIETDFGDKEKCQTRPDGMVIVF